MKIRLLFFAILREITGTDQQELEVPQGTSATDLWELLRSRYPRLSGYSHPPMVAVNESFASPESILSEGDVVAFIPPVSGG